MTTARALDVRILGASFFSTHHASAHDVLAGRRRGFTAPAFDLLVGRARRFTSLVTQMHLEACGALRIDAAERPITVFATCHGEIQTAETLIADFRANAMVSSARFALSVHNTPAGLYSVATGTTAPSTTVTGDNAIAAAWLEAALTASGDGRTVLLSIADEPVPAVFEGPTETVGVAAAFLLATRASRAGRPAQLTIAPASVEDGAVAREAPFEALARTVEACTRDQPSTVGLGVLQPGARLELRLLARDAGP